jgi:flagellin
MGLRVQTNMTSLNALRNLKANSTGLERSMERLSSGYRINKSMDDVAGLAISEQMRGQIRSLGQAERNAQDGISFATVAESALNESTNILIRLRELGTQAASDTVGDVERGFIDVEVQQLKEELDRIANTTEYSGTKLLDGSGDLMEFHVGLRSGEDNRITYDAGLVNVTTDNLGVDGLSAASQDDARDSLETIEASIQSVGSMRANLGAIQSRMSSTISNLSSYKESLTAANSRIRDADIAEEAANLAKTSVLQQAGAATLVQANMVPNLALKLL